MAIELLNKAVDLNSDFSEASLLREDVWHYRLKSFGWGHNNRTYKRYLDSPAWTVKPVAVMGGNASVGLRRLRCIIKTIKISGRKTFLIWSRYVRNVPKEYISPVRLTSNVLPNNPQRAPPENVKAAFIAYVAHESDILQYADFGPGGNQDFVRYESGYPTENNFHQIWLAAWISPNLNDIAAVIAVRSDSRFFESHYKKLKEHKGWIEKVFSFEKIKPREAKNSVFHLRVVKKGVDLTQTAEKYAAFRWLRENLEKLYWVLRVPDTSGWDTTSSTEKLEDKK